MPKSDPLGGETSISVDVKSSGVKASARSRLVAAVDRLTGNVVDLVNLPLERVAERARARTEAERRLIEAAGEAAVKRMHSDPEFARRAMDAHLSRIMRRQENIELVVAAAIEDLRNEPPPEADAGPAILREEFVDRLETYAGGATTDELRERWGRVFASEVRRPGTFSAKSLRLIDELDAATARLFERICGSRLGNCVPLNICGNLGFSDEAALSDAGLILPVGLGHVWNGGKITDSGARELWFWHGDTAAFAVPSTANPGPPRKGIVFSEQNGGVGMAIYALTDAGVAIASIIATDELATVARLKAEAAKQGIADGRTYVRQANGNFGLVPL